MEDKGSSVSQDNLFEIVCKDGPNNNWYVIYFTESDMKR